MHCFALIGSAYRRYQTVLSVGVYGGSHLWGRMGYIWIGDWLVWGVGVPGLKKSQVLIWNRRRGIESSCFAKNTLLSSDKPPSIFLFDARSYSIGYSGLSIDLSGCASIELSGTRMGDWFHLLHSPVSILHLHLDRFALIPSGVWSSFLSIFFFN